MFLEVFTKSKAVWVVLANFTEIKGIVSKMNKKYGLNFDPEQLKSSSWQDIISRLVTSLREKKGDGIFQKIIDDEKTHPDIIRCIELARMCEFGDFTYMAVLECLNTNDISGKDYELLLQQGFKNVV